MSLNLALSEDVLLLKATNGVERPLTSADIFSEPDDRLQCDGTAGGPVMRGRTGDRRTS